MQGGFNRTEFLYFMKHNLMDMFLPLAPGAEEVTLKALDFYYADWPALDDLDRNRESFNKVRPFKQLAWKLRVDMVPAFASRMATEVVMTTYGAISDVKISPVPCLFSVCSVVMLAI